MKKSIQSIVDDVLANDQITDDGRRLEISVRLLESVNDGGELSTVIDELTEYGVNGTSSKIADEHREYGTPTRTEKARELTDEDRESIRSATITYGGY